MSEFTLEILEPTVNYLEVETSFGSIVNNVEIERFGDFNIEIVNTEKILPVNHALTSFKSCLNCFMSCAML